MKIRTANNKPFGVKYALETGDFNAFTTWLNLIERASLDLGLAHPDELNHVHCVLPLAVGQWAEFTAVGGHALAGRITLLDNDWLQSGQTIARIKRPKSVAYTSQSKVCRDVDHARINWDERTIDFDSVHRFPFDAVIPTRYESVSLDIEHE